MILNILLNIFIGFIFIYITTFIVVVLAKHLHKYIKDTCERINDIECGIVAKPKPKKEVKKIWNETLKVWEIE